VKIHVLRNAIHLMTLLDLFIIGLDAVLCGNLGATASKFSEAAPC